MPKAWESATSYAARTVSLIVGSFFNTYQIHINPRKVGCWYASDCEVIIISSLDSKSEVGKRVKIVFINN